MEPPPLKASPHENALRGETSPRRHGRDDRAGSAAPPRCCESDSSTPDKRARSAANAKRNPNPPAESAGCALIARPRSAAARRPRRFLPRSGAGTSGQYPAPDVEALAHNIAQAIEQGGKVLAAYLAPRQSGEIKTTIADEIGEMVRSIGRVAEYYMTDPQRAFAAQTALTKQFVDLWASTLQRLQGEQAPPVAAPDAADKRFADAAWRDNPYFDFIKQAYVLTTRWADDLVKRADELDAA